MSTPDTPSDEAKCLIQLRKGVKSNIEHDDYREDWDVTPTIALNLLNIIDDLRKKLAEAARREWELRDVLIRNGFRECDIPACNCGSWHHVGGYAERFREINDVVQPNNGETLLMAVHRLVALSRPQPAKEAK